MPAFVHGKNARIYCGSLNFSPYFHSASPSAQMDVSETSTFGTDDKTYVVGLGDASLSGDGYFDNDTPGAGSVLNAALGSSTKQTFSVYPAGDSIGSTGGGFSADATSFEITADLGDVVSMSFEAQSSVGYERMHSVAAFGTRSTAGTLSSVDAGTIPAITGGAGYLHVTSLSGSMAIRIEHSTDDSSYTTLVNFGTVTAVGGTRLAYSGTANRYTRLVHTPATTGTAAFVAGLARKSR